MSAEMSQQTQENKKRKHHKELLSARVLRIQTEDSQTCSHQDAQTLDDGVFFTHFSNWSVHPLQSVSGPAEFQ